MPASLGRISFNVGPLCTGLISALLSLDRFRNNHTLPLALGTSTKLLSHSDVSFMTGELLFVVFVVLLAPLSRIAGAYSLLSFGGVPGMAS